MEKPLSSVLLFWVVFAALLGAMGVIFYDSVTPLTDKVFAEHTIYAHGDIPIHVTIADTEQKKQVGLSERSVMAVGEGMLFTFDRDDKWRLWMKDMKFGIDILWLAEDGTIIDIREYVYPDSYPNVFEPSEPSRYIAEVLVGFTSAHNINVGDKIDLNWD